MALKKRKTTFEPTRIPPPAQNPTNFITSKAEELFHSLTVWSIMTERGFQEHSPNYRLFMYSRKHWTKFCAHHPPKIAHIVREFLANIQDRAGFIVFVRGVWVPFDSFTINRVLGLLERKNDEYRELFRSPNYAKILKRVAISNTNWKTKKDGELLDIPKGSLIEEAKAWFYFMNSRLLSCKHVSTLYKDRAILWYAILKNYMFNVGNMIYQSMLEDDVGRLLTHLTLITLQCREVGG